MRTDSGKASTSSQEVQASEMLQIELNAQTMVRLVEELLSVSRTLKESWILGQLPEFKKVEDPTIGITEKINTVLEKVLNSSKFDEEVEVEQDKELEEVKDDDDENDKDMKKEEVKQEEGEIKKEGSIEAEVKKEGEDPKDEVVKKEEENEDKDVNMKSETEGQQEKSVEVKEEQSPQESNKENDNNTNQTSTNQNNTQQNNTQVPSNEEIIDISDNPNFDELDFESFGNMDQNNDDNDIIMLD